MLAGRGYVKPFVARAPRVASTGIALGIATTESDTSFAIGISIAGVTYHYVLLQTNTAPQRSKLLLGQPNNPYILSPGANTGGAYVGYATETDSPLALPSGGTHNITLGFATSTSSALALTESKNKTLGLPVENDSGLKLFTTTGFTFGRANETDSALSVTKSRQITLGLALETDSAFSGATLLPLGLAHDTEIAFPLTIIYAQPTFTPPSVLEDPPILPDSRGPSRRLFRHYRSRPAGINVYIYSNLTVSEDDPDGSDTYWLPEQGHPYVLKVFWGGHEAVPVTPQERSLLEAAGYTVTV